MPSLPKPRLRRQRGSELVAQPEPRERTPQVESVEDFGLRWVNVERPTPLEAAWLEEQFDFHALDIEDVLSRNQRPKIVWAPRNGGRFLSTGVWSNASSHGTNGSSLRKRIAGGAGAVFAATSAIASNTCGGSVCVTRLPTDRKYFVTSTLLD